MLMFNLKMRLNGDFYKNTVNSYLLAVQSEIQILNAQLDLTV